MLIVKVALISDQYNCCHAKPVERPGSKTIPRRPRPARLHLAAARPRQIARAARGWQYLGQGPRKKPLRRGRDDPLCEGQWLGPGDDRASGGFPRAPRARAAPGRAALSVRPGDVESACLAYAESLGSGAFH